MEQILPDNDDCQQKLDVLNSFPVHSLRGAIFMSDEMETILEDLRDSDPDIRESALDRIGVARPANAIELIIPC